MTSSIWRDIIKASILGLDRISAPTTPLSELSNLLDYQTEGEAPITQEKSALDLIAALDLYERAGRRNQQTTQPALYRPQEGERDEDYRSLQWPNRRLSELLIALRSEPILLRQLLSGLATHRRLIPQDLIVELLEIGRDDHLLTALIAKVVGDRGRWLATLNERWSYLVTSEVNNKSIERVRTEWSEGSSSTRQAALRTIRQRDPEAALDLLSAEISQERAQSRASLLSELKFGLSLADEPLLERCLDDRSKEVRRVAAELLTRLEHSLFTQRNLARLWRAVICVSSDDLSISEESLSWEIKLPSADLDETETRDQLGRKLPVAGGQRAGRLQELIALAPLTVWDRFSSSKEVIFELARQTEFCPIFLRGWTAACLREADEEWAYVLIQWHTRMGLTYPDRLWDVVSLPAIERYISDALSQDREEWFSLIPKLNQPWSSQISEATIRALATSLRQLYKSRHQSNGRRSRSPKSTSENSRTIYSSLCHIVDNIGLWAPLHHQELMSSHLTGLSNALSEEISSSLERCYQRFHIRSELALLDENINSISL